MWNFLYQSTRSYPSKGERSHSNVASKNCSSCTQALKCAGKAILPDVYFNMEPSLHSTSTEAVSTLTDNRRTLSTDETFLQ